MSRSNTSFAVLPALIPDIEGVYDAYFAAFEADQDGKRVLDLLFPDGYTSKEFREAHKKATIDWWHHSTEQYTFKCIDLNTLEVVGMALIDVFARQRSDDPETRKFTGIPWLSGEHRERADAVVGALCEAREKIWGGKPYICEWMISFLFLRVTFCCVFVTGMLPLPMIDRCKVLTRIGEMIMTPACLLAMHCLTFYLINLIS